MIIADDHGIVRSGLKQLLSGSGDFQVVAEASHGQTVLELVRKVPAEVLLMDLSMPGISGIELIRKVQVMAPNLPILVLSMHVEAQIVSRVLRAGAAGYVSKDCEPSELLSAVRKVARKGRYIDPALVDSVVFLGLGLGAGEDNSPHALLSPRELQVLERVAAGLPLGQIADELHLSPKTVSTHKMRLMQKLDLQSNVDLLKYAVRHGLTTG